MDQTDIAARIRQVRELAATASAELTSEDHEVTVVAGPRGAVHSVELSPRAFRLTGAQLGELVVRTIRAANAQVDAEIRTALTGASSMGAPAPSLSELRAALRQAPR
ncbi:YbaB/EbfC family nucleoid-associated protein [Catenuloplanes indicus]|uniref:DNA-binding protein YbaB n=1 Tax=Catenuloplanes indicus TaxID=137267 RepID=A0AAE4AVN7_9ACTN|nr:YbaB/EbfC family nucleoid-associated protein [Catenuloplanes indicus]MDQ0364159.1 DNA-binding protein YbaB [Catenuloplanes indicus]